jgi:hypothetical protein
MRGGEGTHQEGKVVKSAKGGERSGVVSDTRILEKVDEGKGKC